MIDCTLVWDFLDQYSLGQLTVKNVREFMEHQGKVDFGYHIDSEFNMPIKDMDLFLRLFSQLGEVLENIPVQDSFSKHDQIFDILMAVADQYEPRRKTIQRMLRDLMFMPSHIGEARKRGARLASQIYRRLGVQTCVLNLNHINVLPMILGGCAQPL
ncbi:MAG: hypothetical protein Q8K36_04215, partial [Alphaproteobacteria bacterium]|nr:hypothetical protein [Alphaproteobacteria bacterium]